MATIELRESDMRRAKNLNAKNEYGLDYCQMMRLINEHKKSKATGNIYKCSLIEYRLTDINYHREVAMLCAGAYDELKQNAKDSLIKCKEKELEEAINNADFQSSIGLDEMANNETSRAKRLMHDIAKLKTAI